MWKEYLELSGHFRLLKIGEELKENLQRFFNIYNGIKKKGLSLEEIEEGIKRDREVKVKAEYEAVFNDEFLKKQKAWETPNAELRKCLQTQLNRF